MATKLKNISKNKSARIIAFVLAVLLFASSGYFASMFIKSELVYNSFDGRPFTQTAAFRDILNSVERVAIYNGQVLVLDSVNDFEKTSMGKEIKSRYDELKQTASDSYDLLDSSGIGIYVTKSNKYRYRLEYNGQTYYFTYNGDLIDEEEFNSYNYIRSSEGVTDSQGDGIVSPDISDPQAAEPVAFKGKPEVIGVYAPPVEAIEEATTHIYGSDGEVNHEDIAYIHRIREALYFIFNTSCNDYNLNYGEISKDAFLQYIEDDYRDDLEMRYADYTSWYSDRYIVERSESIGYAVKFKETGKVFTNRDVTPSDGRELILQKLGGELIEYYENGTYSLNGEPMPKANSAFAQIYYELSREYYNSTMTYLSMVDGHDVEWAYFSYDHDADLRSDIVAVSETLYDAHSKNIFRSVSFSFWMALLLFLLACAVGIWLISSAGKTEDGETKVCFYDKIPFEINLVLGLCVMALCAIAAVYIVAWEMFPSGYADLGSTIVGLAGIFGSVSSVVQAVLVAIFFAVPTVILMSVARNVRAKSFMKHTLCRFVFMPLVWLFKSTKKFFRKLKYIFASDYLNGKTKRFKIISAISVTAFMVLNAFLWFVGVGWIDYFGFLLIPLAIILDLAAIFVCVVIIVSLDRIMHTVSEIRHGNMDAKINTEHMPLFLKRFSEDITSIGDGLRDAVDSAVKDQRMKAELITNVSHDLKTPLTSIVSYVDLLKRCNIEGEDANRYLSILDEKAHRMKKLIEDLVEASKASSGAMEVHPTRINLCEFAAQAVGEHEDELKACGIDIVLSLPQIPVNVMADPMKISRVVENLFSNIRKYALEGTRVYADISENGDFAVLTIKNISKNALNVPAEELMQRFVRGDSSRTGEGSGLGLSIAKNLCELQGGKFSISVDGDLFKAVVELPKA